MVSWITALGKTRDRIVRAFRHIVSRKTATLTPELLEELEAALVQADVPVRLATQLLEDLQRSYRGLEVDIREILLEWIAKQIDNSSPFLWPREPHPYVVFIVGVNGSGKTTTCAKLAALARRERLSILLGATDTFRAAGAEQLKIWADRVNCDVVAGAPGADAAAVAYDALDAAIARNRDVVLIDTAGRMHTREPLMRELSKVRAALNKRMPGAPHQSWIVLDATLGHNAVAQARAFHETIPLTGAIISKLDGTAKAGFVLSIKQELGLSVLFAGLGEGVEDLVPFDARAFARALVGLEGQHT